MINEYKLIRICEVGYESLYSFGEGVSSSEDFYDEKYKEIIEDKLIETGEVYLYIGKFKDNYLQEVVWNIFAPMNIPEEERRPNDGLFWNWDIDIPFNGTTQELQKHINGKKWCDDYYGKDSEINPFNYFN